VLLNIIDTTSIQYIAY